jgi:hypothetical protein
MVAIPYIPYGSTAGGGAAVYPATGCIPLGVVGTGTISKNGQGLTGVGTAFTTQIGVGDLIYTDTSHQVIEVRHVNSNTSLELASVPAAIAGENFHIIRKTLRSIRIENVGAGAATVNGQVLAAGKSMEEGSPISTAQQLPIFTYDKSAGELQITTAR